MSRKTVSAAATAVLAMLGLGLVATPASAASANAVSCRIQKGYNACTTPSIGVTGAGLLHIATSGNGGSFNIINVTDIETGVEVYGNGFFETGDTSDWVHGLTNTYAGRLTGPVGATLWLANY